MNNKTGWTEEADVVVVGFGGAGAVTAITAHDAGAKVIILEKQKSDTPTRINHTPSTRLSGGGWFWPEGVDTVIKYMEGLTVAGNETLDAERKAQIAAFAQSLVDNIHWVKQLGIPVTGEVEGAPGLRQHTRTKVQGMVFRSEFPEIPGSECCSNILVEPSGRYTNGAAFFKYLADAVHKRNIPVLWETPASHLVIDNGEVRGVTATRNGKEIRIRANRGVVLTCGGFEYNEWMKENYLKVNPAHFTGNPASTGDGINMALEAGAALWHMNKASWRVILWFPDHPVAFSTQFHESSSIFVDKRGRRFTTERYKGHSFGYELTNYDC